MFKPKLILAAALALICHSSFAQSYPNKPIRLIVPFAAGGSSDATARPFAEKLGAELGQPVLVENRGGAHGVIGADIVARAQPDGYTLLMMPGTHVLNKYLVKSVPFDPMKDFTPVGMLVSVPFVFITGAQRPYSTLREMLAYGEKHPEQVSVGMTDALGQLATENLKTVSNAKLLKANYKGAPAIATDIIGGHLAAGITTPPVVMTFAKENGGALRPLAITSAQRLPSLPDVPTVSEATGVPGYDIATWFGVAGPANLPPEVVKRLEQAIGKVMAEPAMRERIIGLGMNPVTDNSAAGMAQKMNTDAERWGVLAEEAGLKP